MNFSSTNMFSSKGTEREYFLAKGLGLLLSVDAFIIQILLIQTAEIEQLNSREDDLKLEKLSSKNTLI